MSTRPESKNLMSEESFFEFVRDGSKYNIQGGIRSTASIAGRPSYAASSHTISDLLQGNLFQSHPEDQLSIVNKALTDRLGQLYNSGQDIHGFSVFSTAKPKLTANAEGAEGGSGGWGTGNQGQGSILNESWVTTLPLVHPEGPIIWQGSGKASHEMHLPTDADLSRDVQQHKQFDDLPANKKHPWNMDRVGGPIGGGGGFNTDVSGGPTIMKGENPNTPGATGAFGYLSPEAEQFYISMAWPYGKSEDKGSPAHSFRKAGRDDLAEKSKTLTKSQYMGKKVLVYCKQTKKGCVTTPGDWGTQPYWSNGAVAKGSINGFYYGLAPDVHHVLGSTHGFEMIVRWMPDDTPLGPYQARSALEGVSDLGRAVGEAITAAGDTVVNTVEEFQYAGGLIANHPNNHMTSKHIFTNGFQSQTSNPTSYISVWFPSINRGFFTPSLLNYLWYIMEAGFTLGGSAWGYVHRSVVGGSRLSNHSRGSAIDIMAIGRGGPPVGYTNQAWRPTCDAMFQFLASLPRDTKPDEAACSYAFDYDWYHVYRDPNPTHIHFGFSGNQKGRLISRLKPRTPGNNGGSTGRQ